MTGSIAIFPFAIQLPRLGQLRLKERGYLPVTGTAGVTIRSATVRQHAGHWYISVRVVQVRAVRAVPTNIGPIVGVNLGVKALATLSDGARIPNPRHLKRHLKQIKRCHRMVSRPKKGSNNRKKAIRKLAQLDRTVANQRADTLQQLTSRLAKTKAVVVIEDRYVAGMLQHHHRAQAIAAVGWGAFTRQLLYKAARYGSPRGSG